MAVKYCPQCGHLLTEKLMGERERLVCDACGFIFYINPTVAAGALVERDGQVVLVLRGEEPGKGKWGLPAGYVEADESAEEAAVRETFEETGLRIELDNLLGVYSYGDPRQARTGVLILYSAHVIGGEPRPGDDATAVRFFTPQELPPYEQIAFRTHREALRDWRRAKAVIYRQAEEEEAATVAAINEQYDFERGRDYLSYIHSPDSTLLVAVDDSQIVGFCTVSLRRWEETANIDQIFVLPHYRRWGIATRLIERAIGFAREERMRVILSEVPAANPGLVVYLKAGFEVRGFVNTYYPPGSARPSTVLFLAFDL